MTELISPLHFLAAGGLVFSFEHSTVAGKMVLLCLAIASIFSWSVMVTKMRVIQFARKQTDRFLPPFARTASPYVCLNRVCVFRVRPFSRFIGPAAKS